jgi:hypothetical protein
VFRLVLNSFGPRDGDRTLLQETETPMPPVKVDPAKVREFKDAASFYAWLAKHHDQADEVWIKIHKVDSGLKSITCHLAVIDLTTSSRHVG